MICKNCKGTKFEFSALASYINGSGECRQCTNCGWAYDADEQKRKEELAMEEGQDDLHEQLDDDGISEYKLLGVTLGKVWQVEDYDGIDIVSFWMPSESVKKVLAPDALIPVEAQDVPSGVTEPYLFAHVSFISNQIEILDKEGEVKYTADLFLFILQMRQLENIANG